MPAEKQLSNRAADNWRPLLAVADLIGGEWPAKARKALAALQHSTADDDAVRLLFDIKEVFTADAMHSVDLVNALVNRDSSPWAEFSRNGKPISAARVASMLREFNVQASQIKIDGLNRNGYRRSQFEPLFRAYDAEFAAMTASPPTQDSTASTGLKDQEELAFQDSTSEKEGRVLEGAFSEENQRGRPGRVSYRGTKANGHAAGPLTDIEAVEVELAERGEAIDYKSIPAFLDRRGGQ